MPIENTIEKLVKAWNDQDVETIVATFAEDGSYHEPAGPDSFGRTHTGPEAIRRALHRVFAAFPDGEIIPDGPLVVAGEHAHCEWFFDWTEKNGEKRRVRGVDIFTFKDDKLKHKSAYLKQYAAAA
jgi:hypothetical protein